MSASLCVILFLSSAFFKGLWFVDRRWFGGPLGAPKVSWGPLWGPCAHGQGAPRGGHRTFVIRCLWGLSGALWGGCPGGVSHVFFILILGSFLDELEVGPVKLNRKRLFGSFVRNPCVLRGFGRGLGVAGRPGGAGLWSRWPAGTPKEDPQ
jgi:hypothetical protein